MNVPAVALDETRMLRVVVADTPMIDRLVWFRFALTPTGIPERVRATVPDRLLREYKVTCETPILPAPMVRKFGTTETNMSGPSSLNTPSTEKC